MPFTKTWQACTSTPSSLFASLTAQPSTSHFGVPRSMRLPTQPNGSPFHCIFHLLSLVTRISAKKNSLDTMQLTPTSWWVQTLQPANSTLQHGVVNGPPITTTNLSRSGASMSQRHSPSSFAHSYYQSPTIILPFSNRSTCTRPLSSSWPEIPPSSPFRLAHITLFVWCDNTTPGSRNTKTTERFIPSDAPPALPALVEAFAPLFDEAIRDSLANSSRGTYSTGQRALTRSHSVPALSKAT